MLLQKTPQTNVFVPKVLHLSKTIAGPIVWDQIRSRMAIITFYCQNLIKE